MSIKQVILSAALSTIATATALMAKNCEDQLNMTAVRLCLEQSSTLAMEKAYSNIFQKHKHRKEIELVTESQHTFLIYRDIHCELIRKATSHLGWISSDHKTNCIVNLNRERRQSLEELDMLLEEN